MFGHKDYFCSPPTAPRTALAVQRITVPRFWGLCFLKLERKCILFKNDEMPCLILTFATSGWLPERLGWLAWGSRCTALGLCSQIWAAGSPPWPDPPIRDEYCDSPLHQSQLTLSTRCVRSSSVFCSSNTWAISRAFSSCSSWKYLNVWKIF